VTDLFQPEEARVVGTLRSVRYTSADGTFQIANLETKRGVVTVVGNLRGATAGEGLQIRGRWETHDRFGRQLRAEDVVIVPPTTTEGIVRYLSSGMIEGIGPTLAQRLVDHFGERTLDVIESERARLLEVEGIGRVRQKRILAAWDEQRAVRQVMLFLSSHGVSTTFAHRIYKEYGQGALEVVEKHPYRLARDIFGIGFKSADRIARDVGIAENDPERIAAGLSWVLYEAGGQGHVYLPSGVLVERAREALEVDEAEVAGVLARVIEQGSLIAEALDPIGDRAVYTLGAHAVETELAQRVAYLLTAFDSSELRARWLGKARRAESRLGVTLEGAQREAVRQLLGRPFGVLTGGPGTGKTTILRLFADAASLAGARVLLAAPTGRAARRLAEATGRRAETLHRLLSFSFQTGDFERNADNPLEADLVIVDEASMLDQWLARAVVRAIAPGGCLLLVGDSDQLPSVGAGNVLADLLAVRDLPAARLTEVFRQAQSSDIVRGAHAIREGVVPKGTAAPGTGRGDLFIIPAATPDLALERLREVVCTRAPRAFGLNPVDDVQVLSPMHRGSTGIGSINQVLQEALNPDGERIPYGDRELRVGDKVIQLRNNYQREVFNGEIGRIVGTNPEAGTVKVAFEKVVEYPRAELDELALAYCISIHKSQGSEYPAVIVPVTDQHYIMLQRNLLYTAVTRAQRLVCLIGEPKAIRRAVQNHAPQLRYTGLNVRLFSASRG
jgi:exodeoxyribonuclease V alpha subunit